MASTDRPDMMMVPAPPPRRDLGSPIFIGTPQVEKKARVDIALAEISEVAAVCEQPEPEGDDLRASSSDWAARRKRARLKHLEVLKEHEVYVSRRVPAGTKPMTHRWVDKDEAMEAKSRLTVRGFEQQLEGDEQFFSATPCAMTLRTLLVLAQVRGWSVSVGDCKNAFLQAPIREEHPVWVWPPAEANEPDDHAWLLYKTLPGLKGGPSAWGDHATTMMQAEFGMEQSRVEPCVSYDLEKNLYVMRHMDDYLMVGPRPRQEKLHEGMVEKMLLRDISFLDEPGDSAQFLGWVLTRQRGGFDVSVNRALAEEIIEDAGLNTKTRGGAVPGAKERVLDETPVTPEEHRYYRTQVGRLLFYVVLRSDLQFAVTQLSKHVQAPTQGDLITLKRVAKYLLRTQGYVLRLRPRGRRLKVSGYSDSDWAGAADRRSTTGGVVLVAGACVLSLCRTQATRALSSCEAELFALGSTCAESMFVVSFLTELGLTEEPPTIYSDSSSALALARKRGQGKLKHIEVRLLALQDWQAQGRVLLAKVGTEDNMADLLTKWTSRAVLDKLLPLVGLGDGGAT
jgi:hypothetical protein